MVLEMKHGFITSSLSPNMSRCRGIRKVVHPKKITVSGSAGKLIVMIFWDYDGMYYK